MQLERLMSFLAIILGDDVTPDQSAYLAREMLMFEMQLTKVMTPVQHRKRISKFGRTFTLAQLTNDIQFVSYCIMFHEITISCLILFCIILDYEI